MAMKMNKVPLWTVQVRGYAAACPGANHARALTDVDVESTILDNKLTAASVDNKGALARLSVIFRAGSKYETSENVGVAHMLRICAGLATRNASQFCIMRNIQQLGASLTCTLDREIIAYTLTGTPSSVERAMPYLSAVATQPLFKPWEVDDNAPRALLDLKQRSPEMRIIDLLHKAAFRASGLGNSLFMPKHQVGKMAPETLQMYVNSTCTSPRGAAVGVGMELQEVCEFANSLRVPCDAGIDSESTYKGGEIRLDKGGEDVYVGIGFPGAPQKQAKKALAFRVLQQIMGTGPMCQYGRSNGSLLAKALGDLSECVSARAINASYVEAGLFGVVMTAPSHAAQEAICKIVEAVKSAKLSDEDVCRGKAQAKAAWFLTMEQPNNAILDIGSQAVNLGCIANASLVGCAIDGLTKADIEEAAKQLAQGPLSLVSRGNLRTVPYLDEF